MFRLGRVGSFLAVAAIAVTAVGCGSTASSPSAAADGSIAVESIAVESIAVELSEWKVTPAQASAPAGSITFAVANKGTQVHEFVVVKTDAKADALTVVDNKIDEGALTPIDEIEDIAAGATPTLTVTLDAGHYVLLCNIESHYGQGMRADFDVN